LKPERFRTVIAESTVRLRLNRQLTTLNLSCPTVTAEKRAVQTEELFRLLAEFEMRSTLADAEKRYRQAELF
jgi:DNA polymerase-1